MINEKAFLGKPINFKNKFKIYPPTINDVLDEEQFPIYKNLFLISQEEIEDQIVGEPDNYLKLTGDEVFPTPMEYLFQICYQDKNIHKIALEGFKFFLHQEVSFIFEQKQILIGGIEQAIESIKKNQNADELIFLEEDEYFEFQNQLRSVLGEKIEKPYEKLSPPQRRFKARFRETERRKAKQSGGMSIGDTFVAICCMGLGINPLNIGQLTFASIKVLLNTYQKKEKYEMDIKSILAGADPQKVKPKYWLEQLDNDNDN